MHLTGDVHHSTSLTTVQIAPSGRGTRSVFTKQGRFSMALTVQQARPPASP